MTPSNTPDGPLRFTVDGLAVVERDAPPWLPLAEYLREHLGLTGVKRGCDCGGCGACTIHLQLADGPRLAVLSCLVPLAVAHGYRLHTIHGLAPGRGELSPAQAALHERGAVQCGFCSPGAAMGMSADGSDPEQALQGHLCRCTGYLPMRAAARSLGRRKGTVSHGPVRPAPFRYTHQHTDWHRPASISELRQRLDEHPNALLLAGATDLGQDCSQIYEAPCVLLLDGVAELCGVERLGNRIRIGATTPLSWLLATPLEVAGALHDAVEGFATASVRNMATV